ncbi:MAG: alanine--tRNA ligase [Patescibacteria group bacterium]|nr:alanine--tRNA ligase [Patescibacteria group bacterium]MBU1953202.1 alanine--tRNA ligase [Patescibacteria group bacterium]
MTTHELKEKYIKFFKDKGHIVIPSSSLVPENDPTVLFTTAGMHPLIPFLLGEKHSSGERLVNFQKCIRTDDIDEVGDDVHLTFFEMLGNWSLGDYWKKESISWSFEFLTKELKIPVKKLAVSCFAGDSDAPRDNETAGIWKSLGIDEKRIYFLGKKDNWWGPVGETGPCGPDSEIFVWTGKGDPPDLVTADNKEGWVEVWNNVFMQYEKTRDGKYIQLKQRNVDTGMGVERTTAVLSKKSNVFDIKELKVLADKIRKLSKKKDEKSLRIVVDHARAATFILGDQKCIAPSNSDQGYVLRRLIRRAIRYGKLLHIEKPFLVDLSKIIVKECSTDYPELVQNQGFIEKYLRLEEEKYDKALVDGQVVALKKIEKGMGSVDKKIIVGELEVLESAKIAFDLYQSNGYPLEMFLDDLNEKVGISKELSDKICEDVSKLVTSHQTTSRAGAEKRFKGGLADQSELVVKYHTATHLLVMALREVLGDHVKQIGSNITSERLRFDFPHSDKLSEEELGKVVNLVNDVIKQNLSVSCSIMSKDDAIKSGAHYLPGEQYPDQVKVYYVGDDLNLAVSKEFCGGPHAKNTGELKEIEVYKQEKIGEGKMRVYARFRS